MASKEGKHHHSNVLERLQGLGKLVPAAFQSPALHEGFWNFCIAHVPKSRRLWFLETTKELGGVRTELASVLHRNGLREQRTLCHARWRASGIFLGSRRLYVSWLHWHMDSIHRISRELRRRVPTYMQYGELRLTASSVCAQIRVWLLGMTYGSFFSTSIFLYLD